MDHQAGEFDRADDRGAARLDRGRSHASRPGRDSGWRDVEISIALELPASTRRSFIQAPLAEETWLHIGRSARSAAAGVADASADDARGAYLEIVTQATSGLAQAIADRLERPVVSLPHEGDRVRRAGLRTTR